VALNSVDDQESIDRVFAHLMIWFLRWAGDEQSDTGIFFDMNESRLGMWAEWPKPLSFGRALVSAGYVQTLKSFYPETVLKGRDGFFVPGALDLSWDGIHRRRADRGELVLYLQDPERRAKQAQLLVTHGIRIRADVVPEWLSLPSLDTIRSAPVDDHNDHHPPGGGPPRHDDGHDARHTARQPAGQPAPIPPLPPRVQNVNELINQRNVGRNGTTSRKTREMCEFIRENKYDNPLSCLQTIDGTDVANIWWRRAIDQDVQFVMTILSEMTETDETWAKIGNPGALAMSRIKGRFRRTKTRAAPERGDGGRLEPANRTTAFTQEDTHAAD